MDSPEVEAVPDTEPALDPGEDADEVREMVSVSRLTFGGELIRSMGLEDLNDGEIKAEELVDALVKMEAYGACFLEALEDLEDFAGLSLGDLELWSLDLVLDREGMGKELENKL